MFYDIFKSLKLIGIGLFVKIGIVSGIERLKGRE